MAIAKKLYLENLRVGDELPTLIKPPLDRVQIVRFAAAVNDFNPLNVDEVAVREMGIPKICANGLLPMSYMGQFVQDWLKGGKLLRFAVRFAKFVWPGDTICCKGRILARRRDEQGRSLIDLDLWGENQDGVTILKGHATAMVYFNPEDEARQKRGESPLPADLSERAELPRTQKPRPAKADGFRLEEDDELDEALDDSDELDSEEERPVKAKGAKSKPATKPAAKDKAAPKAARG